MFLAQYTSLAQYASLAGKHLVLQFFMAPSLAVGAGERQIVPWNNTQSTVHAERVRRLSVTSVLTSIC